MQFEKETIMTRHFKTALPILLIGLVVAVGAIWQSASAADCTLTYDNFGKAFLEKHCLFCHSSAKTGFARKGAPGDANFDTLDSFKKFTDESMKKVVVKKTMPPMASMLPDDERAKFKQWIECEFK